MSASRNCQRGNFIQTFLFWTIVIFYAHIGVIFSTSIPSENHTQKFGDNGLRIWLSEYWNAESKTSVLVNDFRLNEQFSNELIKRNGNDYVIAKGVKGLVMACESEYPVRWMFPHPEHIQDVFYTTFKMVSYRKSSMDASQSEPGNEGFMSFLAFDLLGVKFLSVNVTCSAIDDHSHPGFESAHLYCQRDIGIEKQGQTLQVVATKDLPHQDIIIPCRPAAPGANVTVYSQKEGEDTRRKSEKWEVLYPPSKPAIQKKEFGLTFNPKIGFALHNYSIPLGSILFKCVIESDEAQSVLVNVTTSTGPNDIFHLKPQSQLKGKAFIQITPVHALAKVDCCSGIEEKPPVIHGFGCYSPQECDLFLKTQRWKFSSPELMDSPFSEMNHAFISLSRKPLKKDCSVAVFRGSGIVVTCQGGGIDHVDQYVTMYNTTGNNTGTLVSSSSLTNKSTASTTQGLQKACISIGKNRYPSNRTDQTVSFHEYGIFSGRNHTSLQLSRSALPSDFNIKSPGLVTLLENKSVLYKGESFRILCKGYSYFYSGGGRLRMHWKNKTSTVVQSGHFDRLYTQSPVKGNFESEDDVSIVASEELKAIAEMDSVDCYMPVKNSEKWDKITYRFDVR